MHKGIEFLGSSTHAGEERVNFFFFLISKKKILLKKARETQKVHGSEQRKKETTRQKQPLIYSNRRNKIRKGRTIRETPTTRPIKEGLLAKL